MEVLVLPTPADVARRAAEVVIDGLGAARRDEPVLGLATGSSPLGLYAELAAAVSSGRLDLTRARGFALDEYVGLPPGHPQSYREVLLREVLRPPRAAARPAPRARRVGPQRGGARRRRAAYERLIERQVASTCRSSGSARTATSASTSPARRCRRGPGSSGSRRARAPTTPASSTDRPTCRPTASPRASAPSSTRGDSFSSPPGPARPAPSPPRSRGRCPPRARPRCSSGTPTRPRCSSRGGRRAAQPGLLRRLGRRALSRVRAPRRTAYPMVGRAATGCGQPTGVRKLFSTARGQAFVQVTQHDVL